MKKDQKKTTTKKNNSTKKITRENTTTKNTEQKEMVKKVVAKKEETKKVETKKAKMNPESKKALVLLGVAALIILAIPLIMWIDYEQSRKVVQEYESYYAAGETNVVLLARPGCSYCTMFTPIIDAISEEFDVPYHYINTDDVSTDQLVSMLEKAGIEAEDFGTPTTLIIKDGTVVAKQEGYADRESLFTFFQNNGLIASDVILPDETPNLTKLDYTGYEQLLASNQKAFLVIGQTGCIHCENALPVLNEIAEEYNINIYYLNVTKLSSEERTKLQSSISFFKENTRWGTPLNLVIENGDNTNYESGFVDKDTTVAFLRSNGFIA